jgi:hypothetical protein
MFSVIGLVAWAIIGLPLVTSLEQASISCGEQLTKSEIQSGQVAQPVAQTLTERQPPNLNRETKWYCTFLEHTPDWFVAIFTGLLVYVTYRLVKSNNLLWKATKDATDRQVKDTQILQRAYLTVLRGGIDIGTDGSVIGQVIVFNTGHLPARKVSAFVKIMWSAGRDLSDFDSAQNPQQTIVLPVNTELPIGSGALAAGRQRMATGNGYVYVWGRVTYEDGFGTPRWLIYCHRYNCASPKNAQGGIEVKYGRYHYHHNDGN